MAKPYQEGEVWSFRLRVQGQDIYRTGFTKADDARREHDRLRQKILEAAKPKRKGPFQTTVGEALQAYALERFPFMKGSVQEACRVNRYLRSCGLSTIKVNKPTLKSEQRTEGAPEHVYWAVNLEPASQSRQVPHGLQAHRQSQADRTADTDRLRRQLARTRMAQVMPYHIQELVDTMGKDGYKPATIGLERALLRRLFSYARKSWLWMEPRSNPGKELKMPPIHNVRDRVLTKAQWRRIVAALERGRNCYVAPLLALLLETAMRISEPLLHAAWKNVDWERCLLRLQDAKAGAREVPLNPGAIEVLRLVKGLPREEGDLRIFPITYESVKAAWNRACESAGVEDIRIHDLRHTSATRFTLELNGNIPVLKILTGHKTYSQLTRYINVKAADVARLLHNRPLTEADAPAGMHLEPPRSVNASAPAQQWTPEDLPANVVPLFRRAK